MNKRCSKVSMAHPGAQGHQPLLASDRASLRLTLQVGHGDVRMDAVDGPAGLKAAVPARLVVPLALIRGVVVVAENGWEGAGIRSDSGK